LQRCSEERLVWCRKDFLAAFKNFRETSQVEHLLPDEAKKILSRLRAGPPALPSSSPNWEDKYPPPAMPRNVAKVTTGRGPAEPFHVLTEGEWEQRKSDQKERVKAWLAEHPELQTKV
jgi:hypothetical protein